MDEEDKSYIELCIPNREIKHIFKNKILRWFDEKIKAKDLHWLFDHYK